MYKIYEVRDRHTHRIEYLNLFKFDESPEEKFRQNPDSALFAGKLHLYFNTREEQFLTEEEAWSFVMAKHQEYKIVLKRPSVFPDLPKEENEGEPMKIVYPKDPDYIQGNPEPPKKRTRTPKKKD